MLLKKNILGTNLFPKPLICSAVETIIYLAKKAKKERRIYDVHMRC